MSISSLSASTSNAGFNISLEQVDNPTTSTAGQDKSLTVTITSGSGATLPIAITLSYPMIGIEDFPMTELLEQLDGLDPAQFSLMSLSAIVMGLNQTLEGVAKDLTTGGKAFFDQNKEVLVDLFGAVEDQAKRVEKSLYEVISSGKYPDFNDFLKLMLESAQTLRQLASEAKQASIEGQFDNIMMQAAQMKVTAEKNYDAAMKEVDAAKTEAIGSMVAGIVSLGAMALGGAFGGGLAGGGAQFGGSVGTALGGVIEGATKFDAAGDKGKAAFDRKEAELAAVIGKKLEATLKLTQQNEQIADELRDIAKTLRDMVLKLYQDFMSSQNQIIQRSNI